MKKRTFILTKSPVMKKSSLRFICASALMALGTSAGAQGVINTISRTGISGYGGDGGPASAATTNKPNGIVPDTAEMAAPQLRLPSTTPTVFMLTLLATNT